MYISKTICSIHSQYIGANINNINLGVGKAPNIDRNINIGNFTAD